MRRSITPEQVKIEFNKPIRGVPILKEIRTSRLLITPVVYNNDHSAEYYHLFNVHYALFSDPLAMSMFSTGLPKDTKYVQDYLKCFSEQWKKGYPASGFAIYTDRKEFVGNVTVELLEKVSKGKKKGATVEIWYALCPKFWGKGLGSEAILSIIRCYLPEVMSRGYTFDNYPIKKLIATVHVSNNASQKILKNLGCVFESGTIIKYGAKRYYGSVSMGQIRHQYYCHKEKRVAAKNIQKFNASDKRLAFSSFGQSSNTAKELSRR